MQTNLWNIKNSKERLGIRERTEAHKRHLISLVKAKSILNDQNKEWKIKSLNSDFKKRIRNSVYIKAKIFRKIINSSWKEFVRLKGHKVSGYRAAKQKSSRKSRRTSEQWLVFIGLISTE